MTDQGFHFNPQLIRRYNKAGPRYTSYPTALELHDGFSERDYRRHIVQSNAAGGPLSLYFHIPFCDTVCFYCACNKIITKNRSHVEPYLDHLCREIALQGDLFSRGRSVEQMHWGGGSPTFLSFPQSQRLMAVTREHFSLLDDDSGDYSIEIDPRETHDDTLAQLRSLGFNRVSLGVQDFDPDVQRAVNRSQSEAQTFAVLAAARREGFRSTNVDLIYGLPLQTVESFAVTLDTLIAAAPDRFSIFNYAHLPSRFKTQRQINEADLPDAETKLAILHSATGKLAAAGFVFIGMDHFAKPDDPLAIAQRDGRLHRNFQGYSSHADCDLVGLGITSIGKVGDAYLQNAKELKQYGRLIQQGQLPVCKGVALNDDDRLRRAVITQLICHFELDFATIEQQFSIRFGQYFAAELMALQPMQDDGLLAVANAGITVTPTGRLLIRNICMVFDRYLRQKQPQHFSKVI